MFETPRQIRSAVVGDGTFAVAPAPLSQIDLSQIWSVLWRGRMTILVSALAALGLAMLFVVLAPHEYTAVTQILIGPSDLRAVGPETQPAQASDAALLQVDSQVNVLTSDAVLRRVVASEGLDRDPEFVRGPSFLNELMGRDAIPGGKSLAALNELKRRVTVKRNERTYVVEIGVTSRDPRKAAHRQRHRAGLSRRANAGAGRRRPAGVAIANRAAQRAEGQRPRGRGEGRGL